MHFIIATIISPHKVWEKMEKRKSEIYLIVKLRNILDMRPSSSTQVIKACQLPYI